MVLIRCGKTPLILIRSSANELDKSYSSTMSAGSCTGTVTLIASSKGVVPPSKTCADAGVMEEPEIEATMRLVKSFSEMNKRDELRCPTVALPLTLAKARVETTQPSSGSALSVAVKVNEAAA
jgi:hypothetical protein